MPAPANRRSSRLTGAAAAAVRKPAPWPDLFRPPTSCDDSAAGEEDVDARDKPGQGGIAGCTGVPNGNRSSEAARLRRAGQSALMMFNAIREGGRHGTQCTAPCHGK